MSRTGKMILKVIGMIGLAAAILVVAFIGYLYATNRTFDQTLATNLTVSTDWIEIRPDRPLQTRRQVTELLMTVPNYRAERDGKLEIKLPDGRIVEPQIQVIDADGNVLDLRHSGFTFGAEDLITFKPKGGFPETTYTRVRIRSDIPFTCERIFWRERNLK